MRTTAILAAFLALFSLVPATAHATDVEVVRHENIIGGKVFGLLGLPSARETGEIGAAIDVRLERGGGFSEFGVGATFSMPKALDGAAWVEGGYSIYLNNPDDVGVYVGGGGQLRWIYVDTVSNIAPAVYGQIGVMFDRSQSTRMYAELRVTQNVLPFNSKDNFDNSVATPRAAWRTEVMAAFGFGF
ncbi:MAG TPA: hypothetical protein VKE22_07830 [Haliangiales bacterium]|nr:hypothetical protein [Haliangiales bacterium]